MTATINASKIKTSMFWIPPAKVTVRCMQPYGYDRLNAGELEFALRGVSW